MISALVPRNARTLSPLTLKVSSSGTEPSWLAEPARFPVEFQHEEVDLRRILEKATTPSPIAINDHTLGSGIT